MKRFRILFIFIILLLFLFYPFNRKVVGQLDIDSSNIRLNEIMPNPEGSDTDYEWVELYNNLDHTIDLSQCYIDDEKLPDNLIIEADNYLVLMKDLLDKDTDEQSFEKRWGNGSSVWGDNENEDYLALEFNINLKNSKDEINLICNDYEDSFSWENAESGVSFSIDENGEWTDDYLVTPGNGNEKKPEEIYSHEIMITEIYPSPNNDENEWIELYNWGDKKISLKDWIIEDSSKNYSFTNDIFVDSKSYIVIENDDLKITLNNSGESVTLLDPNEEEVDYFDYEKTDKNISNIRKYSDNKYVEEIFQTKVVTKGKENIYVDPEDVFYGVDVLSVGKVKEKELGESVCIQGIISVEINRLGSKRFYVQDETSGIQVYLSSEDFWSEFKVGDKIKVFGELKKYKEELRIYVNDENAIKFVSSNNEILPEVVDLKNISNKYVGKYVAVKGEIIKTSGKTFYIDDGTGVIKILIKSSTEIETPEKKCGQYAGILGIVSRYGDEEDSIRIFPRYSSDIVISDEPLSAGDVLAATGGNLFWFILLGYLIILKFILLIRFYYKF